MTSPRTTHTIKQRQSGAVMMIMLIILIIGSAAFLVSSLTNAALSIARDSTTSDVLAQAREALIGYAASDPNRPGELPCPDFNNDGVITLADYNGSNCQSLVGWLPWKTLGLPELRDANGNHLWYAVANPFHANSSAILNSDTPTTYPTSMLSVIDSATGATLESNVVAIVFSPGAVLSGETRSPNDSNAALISNYLEGDNAISGTTVFQTANDKLIPLPSPTINDRLLTIGRDTLLPVIEKRIAREAKKCLDDYASMPVTTPSLKYPWPAPVTCSSYTGIYGTLFGRISTTPTIDTVSGGVCGSGAATTLSNALSTLQTALNAFNSNNSSANQSALSNASNNVISLKYTVSGVSSNVIDTAGDRGKDFANGLTSYATATNAVNAAVNALAPYLPTTSPDSTMSLVWPATCTLFTSPYWPSWQDEVFYQIASGYQPGVVSPTCGTSCLSISGSGNSNAGSGTYRAAVIVAGRVLGAQSRPAYTTPPNDYLANTSAIKFEQSADIFFTTNPNGNAHDFAAPSTTFITYKPSDPYYQHVNDLVLCLDGKGTNPTSQCN